MTDVLGPARKSVVRIWAFVRPPNFLQPYIQEDIRKSVGTGFVIEQTDSNIRILTCAHVVEQAFSVKVEVPALGIDPLPATVVGFVPSISFDIAILEFPIPRHFEGRPMKLGSSETLRPGQTLFAVGFPLGQDGVKVSNGVYSGYQDLLQHTVSISPGNSGGPLLNEQGEVVGIINSRMVGVEVGNVGYALPIEFFTLARPLLMDPQKSSVVCRIPVFGMIVQSTTEAYHHHAHNPTHQGARISYVHPGSHAEELGMREGMIMRQFENYTISPKAEVRVDWNEQPVHLTKVLERAVQSNRAYRVEVWDPRSSQRREFQLRPRALEQGALQFLYPPYEPLDYVYAGGLILMPLYHQHRFLSETAATYMHIHRENRGKPYLIMTKFVEGDYPLTLSTGSGLLLTHINSHPVQTLNDVRRELCHSTEFVEFLFHNGETQTLHLPKMQEIDARTTQSLRLTASAAC